MIKQCFISQNIDFETSQAISKSGAVEGAGDFGNLAGPSQRRLAIAGMTCFEPFMNQHCIGDAPAIAGISDHIFPGHPNVFKEDFGKFIIAGNSRYGTRCDTRRFHINKQKTNTGLLAGSILIRSY